MKIYFLSFIALFFLNGCINNNNTKDYHHDLDIPIDTISWSKFSYEKVETFPVENIVKNKRYIKLDPNENHLFGGADKVLFRDNIYILDKRQKKIVVFDQKGKGVNTLHKVGQGPEEYVQITDFAVDAEGNIFMIDGVSDKLMRYDSRGEFISSEKLPFEVDIIHCLNNGELLMGLSTWNAHPETKGKRLLIADKDLNIKDSFLDFDEYYDDSYWISYYSFISNGSDIFYNKPIEDFIYMLSHNGELEKAYYIDFGPNRIPSEWRKDIENHINEIEEKHQCLKNQTIITDKYIIGTLWDRTETKPFLINREKLTIYLYGDIAESDISDICDFRNNSIVSLIYPGKYANLNEADLPVDVRNHIANDSYVICVAELW